MNHRRRALALAASAALMLAPALARADETPPPLPPAPAPAATPLPICYRLRSDGTRMPVACPEAPPTPRCYREELDGTRSETRCPPPPEPELESRWYGWQILIVDGASIVTMPILVGVGGYFLGGPIVHAAHGHWGTSAASLGVRVAGPIIGIAAMGGFDCKGDFCGLGALVGAVAGAGGAIALDVALFAHEKVPVSGDTESASRDHTRLRHFSLKPSVTPEMTPSRELHGVSLGVAGTF